jgi:hypothetical protein
MLVDRLGAELMLRGREALTDPVVVLMLAYPALQSLAFTADLGRNRDDGRPLRFVLILLVQDHPHRTLADFGGVPCLSLHGSILSQERASGILGAAGNAVHPVHIVRYR